MLQYVISTNGVTYILYMFCTCTFDYMEVVVCMFMSTYMHTSIYTFCLHTKTYAYKYPYIDRCYVTQKACPLVLHYVTCPCYIFTHAICFKILHKYYTYLNTYKFICTLSYKLNHAITYVF